jgi:hypothetical protein
MQVITAHVPAGRAVLVRDGAALAHPRSRHVQQATLDHYEEVPSHLTAKIVEAHRSKEQER